MSSLTALLASTATANTEINFAFDSATLPTSSDATLETMVEEARAHPAQRIILDGHADPTGAAPYNVALSLRRAESVRDGLVKRGVDGERIVIAAYGEDAPLGASYAAERRVRMWLTTDAVADVVDRTFEHHGTAVSWEQPMTTAQLELPSTRPLATR